MESNILLESGTNELELLEFFVGDKDYGINIAKVSEIMAYMFARSESSGHVGYISEDATFFM